MQEGEESGSNDGYGGEIRGAHFVIGSAERGKGVIGRTSEDTGVVDKDLESQ